MDFRKDFKEETSERGSLPEFSFKTHIVMNLLPGLSNSLIELEFNTRMNNGIVSTIDSWKYAANIIGLFTTIKANIEALTISEEDKTLYEELKNLLYKGTNYKVNILKKMDIFLRKKIYELKMTDMTVQSTGSYDGIP